MMENDYRFPKKLNCLYFDDEKDQLHLFTPEIERAWKETKIGVPIEVDQASTVPEAIHKLQISPNKYHIFLVDILVKRGEQNDEQGILAIKQARQINNDLAIIAFTIGGKNIHEHTLKQIGCDALVIKSSLYGTSNPLGESILKALRDHGIEPFPSKAHLEFNETDFPLTAVLDTVGRNNIISLVEKLLDSPCEKIKPSYIRAGLSGASVLRAVCDLKNDSTSAPRIFKRNILLKISEEEEILKNELSKDISMFPNGLFIPFIKDKVEFSGDWFAIGSKFKENAGTFLDWLEYDKKRVTDVKKVLNSLFKDTDRGLVAVYKQIKRDDKEFPNTILWKILQSYPYRKARIQVSMKEFVPLIKKYDKLDFFNQDIIDAFLSSERINELDKEKITHNGTSFCVSHGDLHGRNILVSENDFAYLIDPANIDFMHWASDVARLSVDLIVSAYDSGEKSYYFERMDEWCNLSLKFINGEKLSKNVTGKNNIKVCTALDWIRTNMPAYHDINNQRLKPEWEFRLALAVEFLRSAYRVQDLTAPKRVLSLLSACQALRDTNTAYNEFKNIYGE